jgi:REP element-mobilizing transposase RayT
MDKFLDRFRIGSARLQKWDYRWKGAYFITILCKNREQYFGEILNGKMNLSGIGIIADILWYEIKIHAKNVDLGAFVIMPNHIHGILILNEWIDDDCENKTIVLPNNIDPVLDDAVKTTHALSLQPQPYPQPLSAQATSDNPTETSLTIGRKRFQKQGKNSVSSIIGSYKSAVSKHAHRLEFDFEWQERFYDNIIRDEDSLHNISKYIVNNPANWKDDRFYPTV